MRIAFVHEYLNQFGGAERMLAELIALYPSAPIYTLIYDEAATRGLFRGRTIHTSFLQNLPLSKIRHHFYPALMPLAMEQFDFRGYDVVLSISASFAKGVITGPGTRHISYCLTPPRFLWDGSQRFARDFGFNFPARAVMAPFISYLRLWDQNAVARVDEFWTISDFIAGRIKKYYGQPSRRIYPPIDVSKFHLSSSPEGYYLAVGRLVSYKKFDLVVEAFNRMGKPLKIVGIGPELKKLKARAKPNIEFLGAVDDFLLAELYSRCAALIFPQEEDFGLVPLEAMASGRPVIAYRGGGAAETVTRETGMFFDSQTPEALMAAVEQFDPLSVSPAACRSRAEQFSVSVFREKIREAIRDGGATASYK
ncbi:MAG TPA: glycosyltransferase [Candidatus Paceibacterota bacterium]|nr:glycosyltransferase [Candidatus Paceibacterota bacterium]